MVKMPPSNGENAPIYRQECGRAKGGIFGASNVLGLALFIGKAVALRRGNFVALIYVIYMR